MNEQPDIDSYPSDLATLVLRTTKQGRAPHEFYEDLIRCNDELAWRLLMTREKVLTSPENERVRGYLTLGLFPIEPVDRRVAAFLVAFELEEAVAHYRLQQRCASYSPSQPLFKLLPGLLKHARNEELIPVYRLNSIHDDGIVMVNGLYARLDPMLPVGLVHWVLREFPQAPLFVRLDPTVAWLTRPPQSLVETILSPANPRWWRNLSLYPRTGTGGTYRLDPPTNPKDDIDAHWEYHVKRLRRIETSATRRNADYLSMMLEEIEESDNMLFGRCIHMDTTAPVGVSPDAATVQHVDLAINVYTDSARSARLDDELRNGKVADASFRTHILRLESAPAAMLIPLLALFFKSRSLLRELLSDQFQT